MPSLTRQRERFLVGPLLLAALFGCGTKTVSAVVSVAIRPDVPQLLPSQSVQFIATVSGNDNPSVSWSVQEAQGGRVDSAGQYTAPSELGIYHVVAGSVAQPTATATATVTVTSAPAVAISIVPGTASVPIGGHTTFSATVTGATDTTVSWRVQEGASGGSVTAAGVYAAPASAGVYHVIATSHADENKADTATVTVVPGASIAVAVTPQNSTLKTGNSAQFSAAVAGTADTSVAWIVQEGSGGGSINSAGLYVTPAVPGTYHVVATSHADPTRSDTATVTVGAPGPVAVIPKARTLMVGGTATLNCAVSSLGDTSCTWSVQEGAAGGTVNSGGVYSAPATPGTYHVVASAHADSSQTDIATISVVATGAIGSWTDVTPAGLSLNPAISDNFGAQDVLADPARPGDFYLFSCYQGVWKSTDYGQTWARISNSTLPGGKQWSAAIDKNNNRNPATPPTLWTLSGNSGVLGVFRSTDGGTNWIHHALPASLGQDGYSLDVDPYDSGHLLLGFHESAGLAESTDGGITWNSVPLGSGMSAGQSWYPFFIDTGTARTTRATWLLLPQPTGGTIGTWRTTDAGTTWAKVETNEHPHGNAQIFQAGGAVYMGGVYGSGGGNGGVYRSTDFGATWSHVGNARESAVIYGTAKTIYSQYAWANAGGVDQTYSQYAPYPGTLWMDWALPMSNGPKRVAVASDGTHWVIVGGNWLAGSWRYVEP